MLEGYLFYIVLHNVSDTGFVAIGIVLLYVHDGYVGVVDSSYIVNNHHVLV